MLAFSFKINFTPKQFTLTESLAKLETPKHVYFCYEFINLGILRVYADLIFFTLGKTDYLADCKNKLDHD